MFNSFGNILRLTSFGESHGKGARKGKPEVTINTGLSFDKVSTMPDFQKEFAQGFNGAFSPSDSRS